MADPAFSICVYCGSKPGTSSTYAEIARAAGLWIGSRGGQLVYGGGNNGLMGIVASATLEAGGRVVGIIPQTLVDLECAKTDCTELHVVQTMHERKQMMAQRADVFVALPGGIGTFEELFEVWTWRQLGYHNKPVGIVNAGGYYGGLLSFLRSSVAAGFMSESQLGLITMGDAVEPLLAQLVSQALGADSGTDLSRI